MAHLATIDPSAPSGAQELLASARAKLGRVPNMLKVMANSPATLKSYLDFSNDLAAGMLGGRLREQIALLVAQTNGCHYCLAAHRVVGQRAGLTPTQIEGSRAGRGADERATAALRFAGQVLAARGHVGPTAFAAVRAAGYGDGEIAELIACVALNVFANFFNSATEPELDFPAAPALGSADPGSPSAA